MTAYKDGVATTLTKRSGSNASSISQSAVEFDVGREGTSRFLDGSIDEMRFWKNYKLTSSEVASLDATQALSSTVYGYTGTGFPNPDAVTSIGNGTATTSLAYDANGNLIQSIAGATTTLYTWDWDGRLVRTDVGANSATTTTTYGYDYAGNRVFQTTGSTTTVYPNPFESIVSTVLGSTTYATSTDFINVPQKSGQSLPVAEIFQNLINGTATGTPTTDYVLTDNLGSVVGLMNASDTLDSYQDFYPYGATRVSSSTGLFSSSKGYIGQFSDASGLSYLQSRYYSPTQGQFLTEDPVVLSLGNPNQVQQLSDQDQQTLLKNPQDLNSYSYSQDNPVSLKDPSGLSYIQLAYTYAGGNVFGIGGVRIDQYGIVAFSGPGTGIGVERGVEAELSSGNLSHEPEVSSENSATYSEEGIGGTGSIVTSKIPDCPSCPAEVSTEAGGVIGAGVSGGTELEYSYPLITWGTPPPDYNTVIDEMSMSYVMSQHTTISAYNPQATNIDQQSAATHSSSGGGISQAALSSIETALGQISALISKL